MTDKKSKHVTFRFDERSIYQSDEPTDEKDGFYVTIKIPGTGEEQRVFIPYLKRICPHCGQEIDEF